MARVPPPSWETICGVVVVFKEDPGLTGRLVSLGRMVRRLVIVMNGTKEGPSEALAHAGLEGAVILQNSRNMGIACALNQGVRRAIDLGAAWALTLDQDSDPAPDMVLQLSNAYRRVEKPDRLAIIAPRVINRGMGTEARYLRKAFGQSYMLSPCDGEVLEDVTTVITSGSLVNLGAFRELGGFRDDFFIDYVDTEFCLRALSHGYRIIVACAARLEHQLGQRTRASFGPLVFYPTHHAPVRWYYMSRNRIPMIRTYGLRFPYWLSYEIVATSYVMLRMLLTEDERIEKLKAFFRGTWDGLRGRMGPMPGSNAD